MAEKRIIVRGVTFLAFSSNSRRSASGSSDAGTRRGAAIFLIVLGGIWLGFSVLLSLTAKNFFPFGITWYALSLLTLIPGIRALRAANRAADRDRAPRAQARSAPQGTGDPAPLADWDDEDAVTLYREDLSGHYLPRPAFEQLSVALVRGRPTARVTEAAFVENRGGGSLERRVEDTPVPRDIRRDLTPAALCAWMRRALARSLPENLPWDDVERMGALSAWCARAKACDALELPSALYPCPKPYGKALEAVGPDGLDDKSGVLCWLTLRDGADIHGVIRDAAAWSRALDRKEASDFPPGFFPQPWTNLRRVILTRNRRLMDGVSDEERQRCREAKLTFALCFPEGLYDLVTEQEVPLITGQWAGSADDAATYGVWHLKWS